MTQLFTLLFAALVLIAAPSFGDDHATKTGTFGIAQSSGDADIDAALAEGGSLVAVDVAGMVCDFCAIALKKTFGRRDEVAASYVDLDTKELLIVLKQGARLDDAMIAEIVKKSGYKTEDIRREPV